jgi:NHL repeat/WD40-like Beta Propeller Repeat
MRSRLLRIARGAVQGQGRVGSLPSCVAGARVLVALLLLCCTFVAAPVLASPVQFGTEGEGAGQFRRPTGIAIDQESGDVYVGDRENNRVDEFSGEGVFVRTWGFGVSDGKSAEFQVCDAPSHCFPGIGGAEGSGDGQLAEPNGVAVDNSAGLSHGDVYVEDPVHHRVERYGPDGEFILTFGGGVNKATNGDVCLAGEECGAGSAGPGASQFEALASEAIAVGPTGTVYVGDLERVQEFSAGGAPEGEIPLPAGAGIVDGLAVDSSGDVYVLSTGLPGVRKYDGAGNQLGEARDAGAPPEGGGVAITVGESDELFVSDPVEAHHVFEYDAAGAQLGSFAEAGDEAGGIALRNGTRTLYVLRKEPPRVQLFPIPPPGPLVLEESASEILPTTARLQARIDPEEAASADGEARFHFEYGESETYGTSTAVESSLSGAFEDRSIATKIEGLSPDTTYHFRVVVENAAKEVTFGPDQTFATLPPVSIDSEAVADVTASSARLIAELNPHGLASEYHFEYGLSSSYEHSAPVPDAHAGGGSEDATFSVTIQSLQPNTAYHYRVVAHNALGVALGPDRTFTTQGLASPELPDRRAYEMVSPPDKHGVSLEAMPEEGGVIEAAQEGDGLAYIATGPIDAEPQGSRSSLYSQLLAKRERAGVWSTQDIATPHQAPAGLTTGIASEYKLFSSALARGVVEPQGATPLSSQATEPTPYRREADGSFTPYVYPGNVPAGTKFGGEEVEPEVFARGVLFVTGTPDLKYALLNSRASLTQEIEGGLEVNTYEWGGGTLAAASVLPNGAAGAEEGAAGVGNSDFQVRGAISADGVRVFFMTTAHRRLYVRDMLRKETLRVDAVEAGLKEAEGGATFQLATPDGSKVFFTDENKLITDATAKQGSPDLYECEIVLEAEKLACRLQDLSVDPNEGEAAGMLGAAIGASEDGRYVYFVARGALVEGASSGGSCPTEGEGQCANLYVADTQAQSTQLVAVLSGADAADWRASQGGRDLAEMSARVSPNGRYLAFMSERPLTGYDNRDAHSGARDEEVYLYDREANTLRCASCNPSGQRPSGVFDEGQYPGLLIDRPRIWARHWLAGSIPGWTRVDVGHALHQPRYLSDSGRLFFDSADGLVSADGNGTQDVYEFEPGGVGSCDVQSGCVSLISSGSSSEETAFLDASESGGDVFFLTAAQLSVADGDKAFDVYDAHVCTLAPGCASPPAGSPPPCVTTDSCRAAPATQPDTFGAPASSTFAGAGDLQPTAPSKAKARTRAQMLAKALKACRANHNKRKRAACVRRAHKRYDAKKATISSQATSRDAIRRSK